MQLAPHLHRIGNDIVAFSLLVTPEGITLVDAGLPGHWNDLQHELRSLGRSVSDIRGVILTHGDSDHIGFAERLRAEHGVPVFVHAADADRARGGAKPKNGKQEMKVGPTLGFGMYSIRKNGLRTHYLTEVVEVADGDVLDLPGAPRIVCMPGHSPGSIAVHSPVADAVFVGDALTTRNVLTGRTGAQPAPFTDDPAAALASLDRLAALPASWVIPGHGAPFHGSPADAAAAVRAAASR
ncbi:MBL fold metallo-hydrolase [Microbacterium sp. RD1]|uniref:MBL fold metallo-hydrolase n=1 Tax=Microbacterium sp. RD1 TaxID=3457313 RepID=UPI003FA5EE37